MFGLGLTAMFAAATIYLRVRMEGQLINDTLTRELNHFVDFKREFPQPDARWSMSLFEAQIVRAGRTATVPFAWQKYESGVYDIEDLDASGQKRAYKLAVYKDNDYWAYLRFDQNSQKLTERQLLIVLIIAVLVFALLSLLMGLWLSSRVMSPVTELASRLRELKKSGNYSPMAPRFANDEVGELALALDDYSARLTHLVERDREFNADVSHELRTPLAVIATTTELLMGQPNLPEKVQERLRRIERAVKQSTELTDALLLLSRSERQAPTDGETTDVARVAEQVIDISRPHLGNKPVEVHLKVEHPLMTIAPSSVVAVALTNLISNAFKYTQQGEVTIIVGHGRVAVEDTGPGIAAEDAERLFERGERGTNLVKGAGLGLAIVRRLCELYGWNVTLAPRPQGGAVATLHFDYRP
ncbi:MAG TPA: HAMP domain-containing sensor histidine kinase [Dokdonella sp.]|uniref:sensor histidine kinase n=1 Tax=Dokdonella sp. TaxID=2291710 RepID=UPI002D7F5CEE|nr:HAMP domain-containing sensor histidine kinase [Dokdonella sp.]HET9033265.1 HAMP domain-containing sensor histidine kinase [Dokdonella sp.]